VLFHIVHESYRPIMRSSFTFVM